jgi:hypothetical protein
MPYSQFTTIGKVKAAFGLTVVEGDRFLPEIAPLTPSSVLSGYLAESLPIVIKPPLPPDPEDKQYSREHNRTLFHSVPKHQG